MMPSAAATEAPPRVARPAHWTAIPGEVIDGGEIVVLAIKPSMWRPVFDSGAWIATACLLVAVLTWLGRPFSGWSLPTTAQVILLVVLARIGVAVVRWVPTWYVLTNRRIIDVRGVRHPRISSCLLVDIRTTHLRPSPVERLTRLGTIIFVADHGDEFTHVWQSVPHPEEVHARIRRAIDSAIGQRGV